MTGGIWDNPPGDTQWNNLRGMFGDKTEALLTALWGDTTITAGHLAAIFNQLGARERLANVAKLLRFAEGTETPAKDELFPEKRPRKEEDLY